MLCLHQGSSTRVGFYLRCQKTMDVIQMFQLWRTQSFTNNSEEAHTCSSTPYCDIGCICAVLGSREVKDGHSTTGCRLGSQSASRAELKGLWLVAWHPCCHDDGNQVLPVWSVSRRRSTLIQMDRLQISQAMMRRSIYLSIYPSPPPFTHHSECNDAFGFVQTRTEHIWDVFLCRDALKNHLPSCFPEIHAQTDACGHVAGTTRKHPPPGTHFTPLLLKSAVAEFPFTPQI